MRSRTSLLALLLMIGCWSPPPHRPVNPVDPDPVTPTPIVVIDDKFDATSQSAALARLASRYSASASIRDGTRRLHGILNELAADGVPNAYCDAVRAAVPAIKPPTKDAPARNLTASEIAVLSGVK